MSDSIGEFLWDNFREGGEMSMGRLQWVQIFCEKHHIHKYNRTSTYFHIVKCITFYDTIDTQRSRVNLESSITFQKIHQSILKQSKDNSSIFHIENVIKRYRNYV